MNPWVVIALIIIAALAGYAGYLHWLLHQQKRNRKERATTSHHHLATESVETFDAASSAPKRTVVAEKAVYLLAEALLDNKMTYTEGCLRITAMAAGLADYERFQKDYAVFFKVAEATAHVPILDAWRALDAREQRTLERERLDIEERYQPEIVAAAQQLKAHWATRPGR